MNTLCTQAISTSKCLSNGTQASKSLIVCRFSQLSGNRIPSRKILARKGPVSTAYVTTCQFLKLYYQIPTRTLFYSSCQAIHFYNDQSIVTPSFDIKAVKGISTSCNLGQQRKYPKGTCPEDVLAKDEKCADTSCFPKPPCPDKKKIPCCAACPQTLPKPKPTCDKSKFVPMHDKCLIERVPCPECFDEKPHKPGPTCPGCLIEPEPCPVEWLDGNSCMQNIWRGTPPILRKTSRKDIYKNVTTSVQSCCSATTCKCSNLFGKKLNEKISSEGLWRPPRNKYTLASEREKCAAPERPGILRRICHFFCKLFA